MRTLTAKYLKAASVTALYCLLKQVSNNDAKRIRAEIQERTKKAQRDKN